MPISLPKGFKAGTAQAGFKKADRDDLGIIYSDRDCVLAALFTRNIFCAAPVIISKKIVEAGRAVRAVVVNTGQANSCTGEEGIRNGQEIQNRVAGLLHIKPDQVLLLSTGVIGDQLKMDKWRMHLPEAIDSLGSADVERFARAMMTTDAFPKYASEELSLSQGTVRLTVMAKGAGMICPNMATMLCVALTDCAIERDIWQQMFLRAVNKTFNRVSVDGDTSTNDSILGLANGASGVKVESEGDQVVLEKVLTGILEKTAVLLVKDGEGAKRIMHVVVMGAASDREAETVARTIGNSQLVKTAIYGGDANWGRIINAVGYSGVTVNPDDVSLELCGIEKFKCGQPVNYEMARELDERMQGDVIEIKISLGSGAGSGSLYASDLGHEYVSLNADYRS